MRIISEAAGTAIVAGYEATFTVWYGEQIHVHVSVGGTCVAEGVGNSIEEALRHAEQFVPA